jgi:anti-sigma B factor antagonist
VEVEQLPEEQVLVVVSGEIDLYTAPQLKEALDAGLEAGARGLVVDLTEVTFVDSTALGVLIGAAKRLHAADGSLAIVCPNVKVRHIFQVTGLDRVLGVCATRQEALSAAASG